MPTHPLWCHLCQTVVGHYRRDRLRNAAHDHIDRAHPTQEDK